MAKVQTDELVSMADLGPVPSAVSRGQFVLALQAAGLLPAIMAAIDRGLPPVDGGADFAAAWVGLPEVPLKSEFAAAAAAALGLSQQALENLFIAAAMIEA